MRLDVTWRKTKKQRKHTQSYDDLFLLEAIVSHLFHSERK